MSEDSNQQEQEEQAQRTKLFYQQNTLLFGDKEVEIINVGHNRWIVRNETELSKAVKVPDQDGDLVGSSSICIVPTVGSLGSTSQNITSAGETIFTIAQGSDAPLPNSSLNFTVLKPVDNSNLVPSDSSNDKSGSSPNSPKRQLDFDTEQSRNKFAKLSKSGVHSGVCVTVPSLPLTTSVMSTAELVNKQNMSNGKVVSSDAVTSSSHEGSDSNENGFPVLHQILRPA